MALDKASPAFRLATSALDLAIVASDLTTVASDLTFVASDLTTAALHLASMALYQRSTWLACPFIKLLWSLVWLPLATLPLDLVLMAPT